MDWGGEQGQYGGGCSGCFLYCTLQRPYCDGGDGRNHSGGRHHVTGVDGGSAPCVSPSVIGAIRTCRDIFDKLCTAADLQAGQPPASCACRNPLPPRYPRECCCCRDPPPRYQPPRSVRFSDDDATCTTCTTWVTTTDEEEEDENEDEGEAEVVQKTKDKATVTSEWTLHVQGGDAGADGEQSIATSDLTNERELEVISETDTPHEKHDYAAAGYAVEELEEEEVLHGGLLEPSVSGGYEIAFSEPEPFTTEQEQEQNGTEQPEPKPPEEPDQSKTTTVIKRVPCKHRKKKSKCCKCKNKNTQHRPADEKPRSLCQCAPIVIFDSPPAKRTFFDFLRGLLPRPKRTGAKTSPEGDRKVLCACGKEMQPFFGYADLEKRGSRDKKVHGKLSKKGKAEASSEEERLRPSKRVATQSDEIKIGTLEECRCAEADIKNTGAKSSRRSSKNKRQSEALNEAEVTTGSRRDSSRTSSAHSKSSKNDMSNHSSKHKQDGGRNRQGSHQSGERTSNCNCNLQEHWAKLKANGQQVPVKENASKTANRKSSLEQPLKPSGISSNSKKPTHVVDVDDCEGSLCNLQDHWAKLKEQQVPVKESHNKIGHKSSNSKKEMHVVDFDENEGSLCNLQEQWAKQAAAAAAQKKT